MMSIPRIISLAILYLLAMVFMPMPCCCCGVLGDPYPATPYEQVTEEQWATAGAQDTYGFYFGFIGIAGTLLFLPATILLHIGQERELAPPSVLMPARKNSVVLRSVVFRSVGLGLMVLWVFLVAVIAAISVSSFPEQLGSTVVEDVFELKDSTLLKESIKILAINVAVALPCVLILARKP